MAEINTADRQERVREQIKTAVTAYRAMLDANIKNRARRTASEPGQVRPQQPQDLRPQSTNAQ
jgi:hypothetical protein